MDEQSDHQRNLKKTHDDRRIKIKKYDSPKLYLLTMNNQVQGGSQIMNENNSGVLSFSLS